MKIGKYLKKISVLSLQYVSLIASFYLVYNPDLFEFGDLCPIKSSSSDDDNNIKNNLLMVLQDFPKTYFRLLWFLDSRLQTTL